MNIIEEIKNAIGVSFEDASIIYKKAIEGGEIINGNNDIWLNERFIPNIVHIDENGYTKMCIDALKILKGTAATDYGSSRQRDMGQLWADMTRGYLAEYAFIMFLEKHWSIKAELGHESGLLEDYLPSDIHKIKKNDENDFRNPNLKIGIKGTKWNGIWVDIPGAQFQHSDIHVLIKVGTGRDHLFAFFKHISVFRDKVLKKGIDSGAINQKEADILYDNLPHFEPVPAYISGFTIKDKIYDDLSYFGKKGRKNYTITGWNGEIKAGDLQKIKAKENVIGSIKFQGIDEFSHESGYLFNTGNLLHTKSDWEKYVINKL